MIELERKFLINYMPKLDSYSAIRYERYYLNDDLKNQVRVQKKNDNYELEKKIKISDKEYEKIKTNISKEEYYNFIKSSTKNIIRDSYNLSEDPNISIKIYYGDYEGLSRVEVEFKNIDDYNSFVIPAWFGEEITNTKLGLDAELIKLNRIEFLQLLENIKN
jgi:CYTH domain-containing protein